MKIYLVSLKKFDGSYTPLYAYDNAESAFKAKNASGNPEIMRVEAIDFWADKLKEILR